MKLVNRAIAVVRPRQPFIDWVNGLNVCGVTITLEQAQRESKALLIPEQERRLGHRRFVERNYTFIFEDELTVWSRDRALWPPERTLELFDEWFVVDTYDMVFDMGQGAITSEKLD